MNHSWAAPSRRGLIGAGAGLAAGAAAQLLAGKAEAARGMATLDQLKRAERDPDHRILLRGGIVLSLDPGIGNFEAGDVLIGGKKILAVGRNLNSTASVVDASGMIVMPGFVDTHHHQYETILRGTLADGVLGSPNDGGDPAEHLNAHLRQRRQLQIALTAGSRAAYRNDCCRRPPDARRSAGCRPHRESCRDKRQ